MLYYGVLDEIAEMYIPDTIHKELHINPREHWISIMSQLIDRNIVKIKYEDLIIYANRWELLLYKRFSTLN